VGPYGISFLNECHLKVTPLAFGKLHEMNGTSEVRGPPSDEKYIKLNLFSGSHGLLTYLSKRFRNAYY
jgi:hypothetical protein